MTDPKSSAVDPRDLLERYHRAMHESNADALADLYAVDAVHEFPLLFPGMPARLVGREEIRRTYKAAWGAIDSSPVEIRNLVVHETTDPGIIVVEQQVAGTVLATGQKLDAFNVLVMQSKDGLLTNVRDYLDALTINRALGRLETITSQLTSQASS